MSKISNLLNGAGAAHQRQLDETRGLVSKWQKTGLLEGIDQEYDKSGMAVLLENQARQLIDEASNTSTGTASKEQWSGVALPLVRRVFGEIAAKDFVSVQPMNLPSGLVFFLDFKYGTDSDSNVGGAFAGDIMGNTSASNKDPQGGLYGNSPAGGGRAGYTTKTRVISVAATSASATWKDVGFAANLSESVAASKVVKLSCPKALITDGTFTIDSDAVRGAYVTGSSLTAAENLNAYHTYDATTLSASFFVTASSATEMGSTAGVSVHFQGATTEALRNDFEMVGTAVDSTLAAQDIAIPQIDVQLRSEAIVAKTRKLKAAWSPEFAQDLNAYHSIDAEAELTSMLSEYISMEIDLEILDMLIQNANTTDYWSAALGEVYDGSSTFLSPTAAEAYTQFTWFQTLGTKIQKVSNKIHQKTLRGGANFLVTSPEVATILESIPGYAADTDGNAQQFAMGVQKVGSLNSRFTVYKNPYMKESTILLGFRGTQFLETGAVYAPYIPLIMTPLVYDPTNFTPRKGVMTRYAKKMVRPEFYGKIHIAGLNRI
ncbi:hypothetical protein CMI47_10435 [Candidatus Pacearchaeota archaeon]|nr:hypothetical protein [Candidatus Pacearchaeota archaeon]